MQHTSPNTIEHKQELLVRVERNERMVQRLSEELNSYTYEPKCPSDFERFNTLKNGFKIFSRHQKEIMDLIQKQNGEIGEVLEMEVREQLGRFKKLESDFAAYLLNMGKTF
ncbi:MAG: hypothetical protein DSY83_05835 [Flavobacteriia bacterium]|nr:MAG: hypothetical protein DSY83_05835 [Flavobacteriia bacterium]